jgi:hypothetical protein
MTHEVSPQRTCPGCSQQVPAKAVLCPLCGWWDRPKLPPDRYTQLIDPIAGGLMLFVSVLVTVPTAWLFVHALQGGRNQAPRLVFATVWHLWVWGLPLFCVAFTWRDNILHGRAGSERLWRVYRHSQLAALLMPLAVGMLLWSVWVVARW